MPNVSGVVDALKSQPATFAMIVISFGLLGFTFYEGKAFNDQRVQMMKTMVDFQREMSQLLAHCGQQPPHT